MNRWLGVFAGIVVLVACQNQNHAVFSPVPSPSPHTATTAAVLQPNEAPPGLTVCLGSGPVDVYLETLTATSPTLGQKVASEWDQVVTAGAQSAAIAIYTSATSACSAELGATTNVKAATSVVVAFQDEGQADRAWQAGIFGFVPPKPGEAAPGVTFGAPTGLGASSFTFVRSQVRLASWHRSVFVALVVLSNLDPASFAAATAAVDARLN